MFPRSAGALLLTVGGVFIVQGFGLAKTGSSMDGNPFWGYLGAALALIGLVAIFVRRRKSRT